MGLHVQVSKSAEKLVRESKRYLLFLSCNCYIICFRFTLTYVFLIFDSENASKVRKGAESQLSASKTASRGIQEAERFVDICKD